MEILKNLWRVEFEIKRDMVDYWKGCISLFLFGIPTLLLTVSLFILGGYYRLDDKSK
ncbi:hypothetical protein [Mammaliicoccus sciuri]|uniref:hypothetical protein n=1 Tax=Mammaliicoccus sciuri TaxID=1296 RepID=UPI0034DD39F4